MEGSDILGVLGRGFSHFFLPPPRHHLWWGDKFLILEGIGDKETFLCLNVSPQGLPGCQLVCLCVPLAYLQHPCPSPLWNAGMVLCRGQQGTSAGEETGDDGGGSDERARRVG